MKKFIALSLALVMGFTLVACGEKENPISSMPGDSSEDTFLPLAKPIDELIATLEGLPYGEDASHSYYGDSSYYGADSSSMHLRLFTPMTEMDKTALKDMWGVDTSLFEDIRVRIPAASAFANMYVIAKPAQGKTAQAQAALEDFMGRYDDQWSLTSDDQYTLVQERKSEIVGDYIVYIISSDNNVVYSEMLSALA